MQNNAGKTPESAGEPGAAARQQQPAAPPPLPAGKAEGATKHSLGHKVWTFLKIMQVRLRFIILMVIVGLVAANWEDIMNRYDRWRRPAHADDMVKTESIEYYCPMHPNVIKPAPDNCPICGMPLVKRAKADKPPLPAGVLAQVQLTPLKMSMGRIGASPVEYRLLGRETRTVGVVDYDETRRATITARVRGRLDKLLVNYTGQAVKRGQELALMYSPDLLVAQEELLTAAKAASQPAQGPGLANELNQNLVSAARQKLLLWGLTAQQVDQIVKGGKAQTSVAILSPISGIVTERKALEGKYVAEGEELYTIADLSSVWLQAKIFESDIKGIVPGTAVEVASTAYPNEIFAGRINFIAYSVDPATRTVAARVEVANPDGKLKPGMYTSAVVRLPLGKVIELGDAPSSAPASQPAMHAPSTDKLAEAYLALAEGLAGEQLDLAKVGRLTEQAQALSAHLPQAERLAAKVRELEAKPPDGQRQAFKAVSEETIKLLQQYPPKTQLYIIYCDMEKAKWLSASQEVHNPYNRSMPGCGEVVGPLKPSGVQEDSRFVTGYYCPIYPDRLFDSAQECPLDKFPFKRVLAEKVLAVPESAVIDTGLRKVVYRQSAPGIFDMVEVQLGPRAGEFYPVLAGLKEGEQVATRGAFLVDAENRLSPGAAGTYFGASGSPQGSSGQGGGHQH